MKEKFWKIFILTLLVLNIAEWTLYWTIDHIQESKDTTMYNSEILSYQGNFSLEENQILADTVSEKYGIEIDFGYKDEIYEYLFNEKDKISLDEETVKTGYLIQYIDKALSAYTDEIIIEIPEKWFVVSTIRLEENNIVGGRTTTLANGKKIFVFSSEYNHRNPYEFDYTKDVHHEIFHAVLRDKLSNSQIKEFSSINEGCEIISEYACSNNEEEMAEAWSRYLVGQETKKGKYLYSQLKQYIKEAIQ